MKSGAICNILTETGESVTLVSSIAQLSSAGDQKVKVEQISNNFRSTLISSE